MKNILNKNQKIKLKKIKNILKKIISKPLKVNHKTMRIPIGKTPYKQTE